MEKQNDFSPGYPDLKEFLPKGYIKRVAAKVKKANEVLADEEQIASSDFMISKVVNEMKYNHPIFPFVIELIMEKKEADKEMENWLRDTINKILTP